MMTDEIQLAMSSYTGLSTGRMNFERQNLQHHSHLSGSLLIHGPSHSPANNGQVLKSARTPEQKAYDKPERSLALFYVVERFFWSLEHE